MSIKFNNSDISVVKYNSSEISELKVNGTSVYTKEEQSAIGTWIINYPFSYGPTESYRVSGSMFIYTSTIDYAEIPLIMITWGTTAFSSSYLAKLYSSETYNSGYTVNNSFNFVSGNEASTYFDKAYTSGYGSKLYFLGSSDEGVLLRTFTITGGDDATNPDLIAWLEANAIRVENTSSGSSGSGQHSGRD